jgi:hypothetical protein
MKLQTPIFATFLVINWGHITVFIGDLLGGGLGVPNSKLTVLV